MLQFRHDARGARLTPVVEPVVAVPARAAAGPHLHEPGPHVTRRASNRHAVRQRVNGLWNLVVSRKRAYFLFASCAHRFSKQPRNHKCGDCRTERCQVMERPRKTCGDDALCLQCKRHSNAPRDGVGHEEVRGQRMSLDPIVHGVDSSCSGRLRQPYIPGNVAETLPARHPEMAPRATNAPANRP